MEHQLRLSYSTRPISELLVEHTSFIERNQSVNQKIVSSSLHIFFNHFSSRFVYYVVNCAVSFRTRLHLAQVHSFHNPWVWVQECFLTQTLYRAHYLACERTWVLQYLLHDLVDLILISAIIYLLLRLKPNLFQLLLIKTDVFYNEDSTLHRLIHERPIDGSQIESRDHGAVQ